MHANPRSTAPRSPCSCSQRSVEPVPATDGLIHLAYAAQATNTQGDAGRHRQRRAGRPAGRLRPDRAQPHHGRAGPRASPAKVKPVRHVAGRHRAGRRPRGGGATRAWLLHARAGRELGADVLRRDLHRPGPDAAPARPRDHAGVARRRRAGHAGTDQPRAGGLQASWPCCARPWSGTAGSPSTAAARSRLYHRDGTILAVQRRPAELGAVRHRLPPARAEQHLLQRTAHGPDAPGGATTRRSWPRRPA